MESADKSLLKWENFDSVLGHNFNKFLKEKKFCDVSLASGKEVIRAHKLMLAACSPYFEHLLDTSSDYHSPVIVLNEICHEDILNVLEFCYKGSVAIPNKDIERFMKVAQTLQLKGMTKVRYSGMKVPVVRHQMPSPSPDADGGNTSSEARDNNILQYQNTLLDELDELITNNPFTVKPEPTTPDKKRRRSVKRKSDDGKIYLKKENLIIFILIILSFTDLNSSSLGKNRNKQRKVDLKSETTPKFICKYCYKNYAKNYLVGHEKSCKENPNRIKFECPLCAKELSRNDKVAAHIRTVHSRGSI